MKVYETGDLRVLGVVGHGDAGKTTLTSAMLFNAGAATRLGVVDQGTTVTDFDEEEIKRRISINSAACYLETKKNKITFIDTPGYGDFIFDSMASLRVCDSVLVVVCAVSGVEVFTEKVWEFADDLSLPRLIFINKLDRERASFERTLDSCRKVFNKSIVPVQLPVGSESDFKGVIDLIQQKMFIAADDKSGKFSTEQIPSEMESMVAEYREKLIESVAETDDALLEKYLDSGELDHEEIVKGLRKGVVSSALVPVFCGSATNNIGVSQLIDGLLDYMPSPMDRPPVKGINLKTKEETQRNIADSEPFSAFVFKTLADPYAGKITLFRVYSGVLKPDRTVFNTSREKDERIGQINFMQGKTPKSVEEIHAGEIGSVMKLKETFTGDTLSVTDNPIVYEGITFPKPMISFAIAPKSKGDEEKINVSLQKLAEEDPTFTFGRDTETKEQIIRGMGQLHIEVIVDKLKKKFGVDVDLHLPRVPYKETIKKSAKAQGKYKKQTGGRGQYGDCWLEIEPLEKGSGFEFVDKIVGGVVPKQYVPAVEKGVIGAMEDGIYAGYPITDLRVTIYDGSYHTVDSSEMAFKIAGSMGFKIAFAEASPCLLEPIVEIQVVVPEDCTGDIMGDLNGKRGRVLGMEPKGHFQIIKAHVPQAEILKYAAELKSMTGGRGTYTMVFSHYEEVPAHIADKIIEQSKKTKDND